MNPEAFRALLIADNSADALLVSSLLSSAGGAVHQFSRFTLDAIAAPEAALEALARKEHHVVVLDLSSPDRHGIETLRAVRARAPDVPVVVLSGLPDVELAREALALGAQDFLTKKDLQPELITRALRYAIERQRAQDRMASAQGEKEVLLQELHHRAKNNLQVVSSLLQMQARRTSNTSFKSLVASAQQRIDAIALAHDQLHRAPDFSRVDFSSYLTTLVKAVHSSYGGEAHGIDLDLSIESCDLPLHQAVPAGLVANELLTNAMKHAFPDERRGRVEVRAGTENGRFSLCVTDDGVGLPDGFRVAQRPLGLEIVATLAEQLDATLDHESHYGTRFCLTFSCEQHS